MQVHKDTYMFVTPKFIKEYSGDLDSAESDLAAQFIDYLRSLVERKPLVMAGETLTGAAAPSGLDPKVTYAIVGSFFGERGSLAFTLGKGEVNVDEGAWQDNVITFSVSGELDSASPIGVYQPAKKGEKGPLIAATPMSYTIRKASDG